MDEIQKRLLKEVADLDSLPIGAYNIRVDGAAAGRNSTAHIEIVPQTDRPGIEIHVKDGTVNEAMHIPVIMQQSRLLQSSMVHSPTPANTIMMVKASLLPREWKNRSTYTRIRPSTTPSPKEPTIWINGWNTSVQAVSAVPLSMVRASAISTAYRIRPRASSMATTGSSILVTGPFALY